jgi:predicted RNA-binding Zn-ribbon protein involved in translation (DUF1610 family)
MKTFVNSKEGAIMHGEPKVSVGVNIGYGLLFYVTIAIASGLGIFLSIIISEESDALFAVIGGMMIIYSAPVIAFVIGIIQGKLAQSSEEALAAGGITGGVGHFLLIIIVVIFLSTGISIKFPVEVDIQWGELVGPWALLFIPTGILGALSAYFSAKFIFPTGIFPFPKPMAPTPQQYAPQPYQPQSQQRFGRFGCPNCGNAFVEQVPTRPTMTKCTSCGAEVIIEPPY